MGQKDEGFQYIQDLYLEERDKVNYAIKRLNEIYEDLEEEENVGEAKWGILKLLEYIDD